MAAILFSCGMISRLSFFPIIGGASVGRELAESHAEALRREVMEELALDIEEQNISEFTRFTSTLDLLVARLSIVSFSKCRHSSFA